MDTRRLFCVPERRPSGVVRAIRRLRSACFFERRRSILRELDGRIKRTISKARRMRRILTRSVRRKLAAASRDSTARAWERGCYPGERLGDLSASGTDVLLISGPEEIRPFEQTGVPARGTDLRIEVLNGLDHALRDSKDRTEVGDMIIAHIVGRFGGA